MFSFFRINDPYRLLFSVFLLILIRIIYGIVGMPVSSEEFRWLILGERLADGAIMYKEVYDYTAPLAAFVYKSLSLIFGRSVTTYRIFATLIVIFNASVLNNMLIRNKAFGENNYLPSLFYIIFAVSIPDHMALSPQLMSSTFILLALSNIFRRIDNEVTDELFLYAGLYIGIATMFFIPSIVFFVSFIVALVLFSSPVLRRLLLYFYGFILPFFIACAFYYWKDALDFFLISCISRGLFGIEIEFIDQSLYWIGLIPIVFWLAVSLFTIFLGGRFTSNQSRIIQIFLLFGLAVFTAAWFDVSFSLIHGVMMLPVIAFFLSHYVLLIRKRILRFIIPWLVVIPTLVYPYFYYKHISDLSLHQPRPQSIPLAGERLMILSNDLNLYRNHVAAGPVIDVELSKRFLNQVNDYRSAILVYEAITIGKPRIIIDEWDLMPRLKLRFPLLEEQYRAGINNYYYRKASN